MYLYRRERNWFSPESLKWTLSLSSRVQSSHLRCGLLCGLVAVPHQASGGAMLNKGRRTPQLALRILNQMALWAGVSYGTSMVRVIKI